MNLRRLAVMLGLIHREDEERHQEVKHVLREAWQEIEESRKARRRLLRVERDSMRR